MINGISSNMMQAMMSANTSLTQARTQSSVKTQLQGREKVLQGELEFDKSMGLSTENKEKELEDVQKRKDNAEQSQMNMLSNANTTITEAAEAEKSNTSMVPETDETKATEATESSSYAASQIENTFPLYTKDGQLAPTESAVAETVNVLA